MNEIDITKMYAELSSLAANPRLQKHSGRERVRPDELVRTGIQGFGDPYTIPVRLARPDDRSDGRQPGGHCDPS